MKTLSELETEIIELETQIENVRAELATDPNNDRLLLKLSRLHEKEVVIKPQFSKLFLRSIRLYK